MPKTYKPILIESIKAAVNIEKHRFIGFDGNYCQDKKKALGVSDVEVEAGQFAPVAISGILLVETSGVLALGDKITSDALGKAKLAANNDEINGYAVDPSAGTGEIVRIAKGI